MPRKNSRNSKRIEFVQRDITDNVLQDEDYKRHIREVAQQTGLPVDAVELVLQDMFLQVPKIIYRKPGFNKRISFFGFFTLEIKRKFNINNLNNLKNGEQ